MNVSNADIDAECRELMHRYFYLGWCENGLFEGNGLYGLSNALSTLELHSILKCEAPPVSYEDLLFKIALVRMILSLHKLPYRFVEKLSQYESLRSLAYWTCELTKAMVEHWLNWMDASSVAEEDLETSIRLFPSLLQLDSDDRRPLILKAAESYGFNAVPFVPLLAELGVEFGRTADRGGLLMHTNYNVLEYMAGPMAVEHSPHINFKPPDEFDYIEALEKLRKKKLFFKEDIARLDLMSCLLSRPERGVFSAFERVRYLANLDPMSLGRERQRHRDWILPLHHSVTNYPDTSEAFQTVLESGIHHFPSKLGFLFHMDESDRTPFQMACDSYGNEFVSRTVQKVFAKANYSTDQILESLVALSVDESVHPEGVYLVLRGEHMKRGDPSTIMRRALCRTGAHGDRKRKRNAGVSAQNSNRTTEIT